MSVWLRSAGLWTSVLFVALLWFLLELQGVGAGEAARELWNGAFGSPRAWLATLRAFSPLCLCALSVTLAFRAGLWNIGAEGQLVLGALAGIATGLATNRVWLALLGGAIAGTLWAFIPAILKTYRGVPEVLCTIMMNFLALELLRALLAGSLQESSGQFLQSDPLPAAARLPEWSLTRSGGIHAGVLLTVVLAPLLFVLLWRTRVGLLIRGIAKSPATLRAQGFPVARLQVLTLSGAGALAGLAGAVEVTGVSHGLDTSIAQGAGYAAIAVALAARLHPLAVVPTALLFAGLASGTDSLQWIAEAPGLDRFALVVQGLVVLFVLAYLSWSGRRQRHG